MTEIGLKSCPEFFTIRFIRRTRFPISGESELGLRKERWVRWPASIKFNLLAMGSDPRTFPFHSKDVLMIRDFKINAADQRIQHIFVTGPLDMRLKLGFLFIFSFYFHPSFILIVDQSKVILFFLFFSGSRDDRLILQMKEIR